MVSGIPRYSTDFSWLFHGRSLWRIVLHLATLILTISLGLELSLTVPLANSSAFLFTVLGEWYVDRKVIAKETWLGLVLVLGGIGLCVHSKNQTMGQ